MSQIEQTPQSEEQIPLLAEEAIRKVVAATQAAGLSILVRDNDILVEVFPDGTRKAIKELQPRVKVSPGVRTLLPE